MYYDFKVKKPNIRGKIYTQTVKGSTYVKYEYAKTYLPEKKYVIPKRATIGKLCEEDTEMMYPNSNYYTYFPEEDFPESKETTKRSSCIRVGTYFVIKKIIKEYHLEEMLYDVLEGDYGLLLDLAAYSIITESNRMQHYPDYAYNHPLFTNNMRIYSDSKVSTFLRELTREKSIEFLNLWNDKKDHREKIYISYDSTNKTCQAGDIEVAEFGKSKANDGKPIINVSLAYDRNNKEPLFYEEYAGSIIDVSQLKYMLEKTKEYGYKKIGFILDRGYFSKENIRYIDKCGYDFLIMAKGIKHLVSELVLENKDSFEEERSYYIREYGVQGKTIKSTLYPSDEKERYFHIYYNTSKYSAERIQLEQKINRMQDVLDKYKGKQVRIDKKFEKYFDLIYYHEGQENECFVCAKERGDVIKKEMELLGYFVIITSKKMTAKEALILYKSRDASEKLFRADKTYLGNKSFRVHSEESAQGKLFISFIALIIRNKIYTTLQEYMIENKIKKNYFTVPQAIRELEKIEIISIRGNKHYIDHAVTKTQKDILKAFKIDANYIKSRVKELSEELISINNLNKNK